MRLLRLTNSYDTDPAIAEDANKKTLVESLFQEATGEPMETTVRVIWPDPVLPELIDKWLKRYQPDVVLLVVSSYWFTYVSAPARIQRAFGRVGKPISDAGLKAAGTPWLAHNAAFRLLRTGTLRVIGGSTWFTVDQVNESMERCIRVTLAHEGTSLAVRGPRTPYAPSNRPKDIRESEAKRRAVHERTRDLCQRLHVPYFGWDDARPPQQRKQDYQGDLVHGTEAEHQVLARQELELLLQAWRQRVQA